MTTLTRPVPERHGDPRAEYSRGPMLVCPGCGGRNPPDQDECSFCNRRRPTDANGSRLARRGPLIGVVVALLLLAVAIGVVLLMFSRSAALSV